MRENLERALNNHSEWEFARRDCRIYLVASENVSETKNKRQNPTNPKMIQQFSCSLKRKRTTQQPPKEMKDLEIECKKCKFRNRKHAVAIPAMLNRKEKSLNILNSIETD